MAGRAQQQHTDGPGAVAVIRGQIGEVQVGAKQCPGSCLHDRRDPAPVTQDDFHPRLIRVPALRPPACLVADGQQPRYEIIPAVIARCRRVGSPAPIVVGRRGARRRTPESGQRLIDACSQQILPMGEQGSTGNICAQLQVVAIAHQRNPDAAGQLGIAAQQLQGPGQIRSRKAVSRE